MVRRNRLKGFMLLLAVVALAGGVGAQASGFKPLGNRTAENAATFSRIEASVPRTCSPPREEIFRNVV
jgi:hypothetical protein